MPVISPQRHSFGVLASFGLIDSLIAQSPTRECQWTCTSNPLRNQQGKSVFVLGLML